VAAALEEVPAWTQQPFQALLFKVAGLTLAVPLVDLNGIVEWHPDAITAMPGHADFYLGLLPHLGKNVALIDTARFVLPPDRLRDLAGSDPQARLTRIVLIQEGRYGLACDAVAEVITLQPQDVRWRTSRTQRRWLAGTVVAQMCALIDAPAFAQMLADKLPVKAFRE
jgi:purine-binding chemotaxis protein CheW